MRENVGKLFKIVSWNLQGTKELRLEMRLDYVLYGVAIVCFIIAGAFAVANVPGYTLDTTSGIAVTMIFALLGIISGAVGYSARPKAMMTTTQPSPTETMPSPQEVTGPSTETLPQEEMPPPPPPAEMQAMPLEEPITTTATSSEPIASETQMTAAVEPTPPAVVPTMEPEQPIIQEEPMKAANEEKPKPTRRRRKKAQ